MKIRPGLCPKGKDLTVSSLGSEMCIRDRYRDGLFPLELYDKEEAGAVIDMIESRQQRYYEEYGLHFIHASDEWYITCLLYTSQACLSDINGYAYIHSLRRRKNS